MAKLTAAKRSMINTIESIAMVSPNGTVIHKFPIRKPVEDEFVVSTEEFRIPSEEFYLRLEGLDNRK